METQTKAIEPVPGGMWQKRAAELLGAGVGAVNHWVRTYREGGMAALRPENRDAGQAVFCQVGVGRFGVSFSPCERRVSGRFGVGRSCWLLVIALVIA